MLNGITHTGIRWGLLSLLVALLLAGPLATTGLASKLAGLKVGIVNINEALNRSNAGKSSKKILLSSRSQMENELKAKETALKKAQEDLRSNIMLSDEARRQREQEILMQQRELQQELNQAQRELQNRERTLTESIFLELKTVIQEIGTEEQFDVILEGNASQVILYTSTKFTDLTEKVIERYNAYQQKK